MDSLLRMCYTDIYLYNRKNKTVVSGLGLSIAKEILTAHGAKFGVDNRNKCAFLFELQS